MVCSVVETKLGEGSQEGFVAHLSAMANALFPQNGIEWFSHPGEHNKGRRGCVDVAYAPMPESIWSVMASVSSGPNEGLRIEVGVQCRGDDGLGFTLLARAKTFGSREESWQIARVLQNEAERILVWREQSRITEIAAKLPRQYCFSRMTSKSGDLHITVVQGDAGAAVVVSCGGDELDHCVFENAEHSKGYNRAIEYAMDWALVAQAQPSLTPVFDRQTHSEVVERIRSGRRRALAEAGLNLDRVLGDASEKEEAVSREAPRG